MAIRFRLGKLVYQRELAQHLLFQLHSIKSFQYVNRATYVHEIISLNDPRVETKLAAAMAARSWN